jgi:capsular polysaccharide biosynthesis protein
MNNMVPFILGIICGIALAILELAIVKTIKSNKEDKEDWEEEE